MTARHDRPHRGRTGAADVSTGGRSLPDSVFYVGSIAKQFVAACVAMLEHDGELDLGDPVSRFVPSMAAWATGSRSVTSCITPVA